MTVVKLKFNFRSLRTTSLGLVLTILWETNPKLGSHFHAVLGKNWSNSILLSPLRDWHIPLENSGSTAFEGIGHLTQDLSDILKSPVSDIVRNSDVWLKLGNFQCMEAGCIGKCGAGGGWRAERRGRGIGLCSPSRGLN